MTMVVSVLVPLRAGQFFFDRAHPALRAGWGLRERGDLREQRAVVGPAIGRVDRQRPFIGDEGKQTNNRASETSRPRQR
jgi:hypothetical protein